APRLAKVGLPLKDAILDILNGDDTIWAGLLQIVARPSEAPPGSHKAHYPNNNNRHSNVVR
ncbi:hypothetical protein, partial [Kluyvera intermedia]|uniref:hypothetical protein n=1 Tax=Kluyvera intermedia TaxID=61648 RepID=UPI003D03C5D4